MAKVSEFDGQPFTQYPEAIRPLLNTYMVIIYFIGLWELLFYGTWGKL